MSNRFPCKSEGCSATILQSTANRTGGYCMPCHQKMERKAYEEYVKQNRKDVNLYEGVTDFVEILKLMHTHKNYDPLKNYIKYEKSMEEVYNLLSKEELERLKSYALGLIKNDELELAQDILTRVVCYRNEDVGACLRALIAKGECYPEVIFKYAPNDVRDYLINQINNDSETLNLNHILLALAWIGDEKVVELFSNWKNNPPKWRDKLYIAPEEYSLEAGWEITQAGKRRNLFYEDCYKIENYDDDDNTDSKNNIDSKTEPVIFLKPKAEKCEWCGKNLTNIFSFDLKNQVCSFIDLNEGLDSLDIMTCIFCNCYGYIYSEFDTSGKSKWSDSNIIPQYLYENEDDEFEFPKKTFVISKEKRNPYHSASQFLETTFSQIGGCPTWIQDAEYPKCPKCSKYMKFIAQFDWEDVENYGEGIYYAFICSDCNTVATHYQQS